MSQWSIGDCAFRKTLLAAEKTHAAHGEEIEKYESDLREIERLRKEYEEKLQDESQSAGRNLALEEDQVRRPSLVSHSLPDLSLPLR